MRWWRSQLTLWCVGFVALIGTYASERYRRIGEEKIQLQIDSYILTQVLQDDPPHIRPGVSVQDILYGWVACTPRMCRFRWNRESPQLNQKSSAISTSIPIC